MQHSMKLVPAGTVAVRTAAVGRQAPGLPPWLNAESQAVRGWRRKQQLVPPPACAHTAARQQVMGTRAAEHVRQQREPKKKELQRQQAYKRYTLPAATIGEVCSGWVDVLAASEGVAEHVLAASEDVAEHAGGLGTPTQAVQGLEQFANAYYSSATRCASFRPRTASKVMAVVNPATLP